MADEAQAYHIGAIRRLLLAAFTAEELRRFCQDRPLFHPLVTKFGPGQGLDSMADQVIDYCATRLLFAELLGEIKKGNPRQYARFAPYYHFKPLAPPTWPRRLWVFGALLVLTILVVGIWWLQPRAGGSILTSVPTLAIDAPAPTGALVTHTSTVTTANTPVLMPESLPFPGFTGKVCQIRVDYDTNTIFLRQDIFDALGLPLETSATVIVLDTGRSVTDVTASLDSGVTICGARLSKQLRELLGVDGDTAIEPESHRPDRRFYVIPTDKGIVAITGKVCKVKAGQDSDTIYLRQAEFDVFGVPAGTTVSVTSFLPDTPRTVVNVALVPDRERKVCLVSLSEPARRALGVDGDVEIEPESSRPDRLFVIHLSH